MKIKVNGKIYTVDLLMWDDDRWIDDSDEFMSLYGNALLDEYPKLGMVYGDYAIEMPQEDFFETLSTIKDDVETYNAGKFVQGLCGNDEYEWEGWNEQNPECIDEDGKPVVQLMIEVRDEEGDEV